MKNKDVSRMTYTAILAAIYVVLALMNPFGWGMFQFRISEALSVLPFFNRKSMQGIVLGTIIANSFSPMGIFDVGAGVLTAVIAYTISKYVKNKYLNAIIYSVVAGAVVGSMLFYVVGLPLLMSFVSIFISSLVIALIAVFLVEKNEAMFKKTGVI